MDELMETMDGDRVVFLTTDGDDPPDLAGDILKDLAGRQHRVVFISISKPASTRKQLLQEDGLSDDSIFFIDGSNTDEQVRAENVVFTDPNNLTDLSISMNEAVDGLVEQGPVIVVLDAITSLAVYHDEQPLKQFLHTLCTKMRGHGVPVLLIGIDGALSTELDSTVTQFADITRSWNS